MRRRGDDVLIGRANETAILERAVLEATQGQKRGVVLQGEPGMGKTALLFWAHAHAVRSGLRCGLARAFEVGPTVQSGLLIKHLLSEISHSTTEDAENDDLQTLSWDSVGDAEGLMTQPYGLLAMLEREALTGPVGIFLDDLQWMSVEAMETIRSALRLVRAPLLFVTTTRSDLMSTHTSSLTPEFMSEVAVDFVELTGLPPDSVGEFASLILKGPVLPSLARELHERTLGNPLFVAETIRAWKVAGEVEQVPGGYWAAATPGIRPDSRSLLEMISTRLSGLRPVSRKVAMVVAALRRLTSPGEVASVLRLGNKEVSIALVELDEVGVISRGDDGRYGLAHPLFEAALLLGLNKTRKAALHERIFEALKIGGTSSPGELAYHAVRSLRKPMELTDLISKAAREAEESGSYREAADWYAQLAKEATNRSTRYTAMARHAAAAEHFDPAMAVSMYDLAISFIRDKSIVADLLLGRGRALRMIGRPLDALADLHSAASMARGEKAIEIRLTSAVVHAAVGETSVAAQQLEDIAAETLGTPQYPRAMSRLAMLAYQQGDLRKAHELSMLAESQSKDPTQRRYLRTNLSWFLLLLGEWAHCEQVLEETMQETKEANDLVVLPTLMTTAACLHLWRGYLAPALDFASQALRLTTQEFLMDRIAVLGVIGAAFLDQGDPIEAARTLEAVPDLVRASSERYEVNPALIALAEATLLNGEIIKASEIAAYARDCLMHNRVYEVSVQRLDAQIRLVGGDPLGSLSLLSDRLQSPIDIPFELGRIYEVLGDANLALNRRLDALESLESALQTYTSLGARLRRHRVESKIARVQPRRRGRPRARDRYDLTGREAEILTLMSIGRTNRDIATSLFISEGTVKKHLDNIRSKVQATTRSQLIAFAQNYYSDRMT